MLIQNTGAVISFKCSPANHLSRDDWMKLVACFRASAIWRLLPIVLYKDDGTFDIGEVANSTTVPSSNLSALRQSALCVSSDSYFNQQAADIGVPLVQLGQPQHQLGWQAIIIPLSELDFLVERLAPLTSRRYIAPLHLRFDKEMKLGTIKRSGHHAIMNWIGRRYGGTVALVNDSGSWSVVPWAAWLEGGEWKACHAPLEILKDRHASLLLYNLEGLPLGDFKRVGLSHPLPLLVLRDCFNLMSSLLSAAWIEDHITIRHRGNDAEKQFAFSCDLWKEYAREYLGLTRKIALPIWIKFNDWFQSQEYRDGLARKLRLSRGEEECVLDEVPASGGGSSFDGMRYQGQARQMDVLNRYKVQWDHPWFQKYVRGDPEMVDLNRQIFPEIKV